MPSDSPGLGAIAEDSMPESSSMAASRREVRAPKSRKDRPCDHCRRLKHSCKIVIRGEPCTNCLKGRRECTFDKPAPKRTRTSSPSLPPATQASCTPFQPVFHATGNIEAPALFRDWPDFNTSFVRSLPAKSDALATPTRLANPAAIAASASAGQSSVRVEAQGRGFSSLGRFMETLERSEDPPELHTGDSSHEYPSLDQEVTDLEESHYLGHRAFGDLTLDPFPTGHGIVSSPAGAAHPDNHLQYRQVGSSRDPAFFLRASSKVYGLSNADFVAEKAYKAITSILRQEDSELPNRLVQIFLQRSLPALPILNKSRLEHACYAAQGSGNFPHAILTGIMAHAAIHVPSLRHRIKELWSIVLHLLDNEYRQPRLQTIQLALIDIYGRPTLNPGGNHISISRAIGAAQLLGLHRDSSKWKLPKWERESRQLIWWCLYIADKWNAFCYGRPTNMIGPPNVPLPSPVTLSTSEREEAPTFVQACKLSVILDTLLPVIGLPRSDSPSYHLGDCLPRAFKDLDDLSREVGGADKGGFHSTALSRLGLNIAVCRMSLDGTPSTPQSNLHDVLTGAIEIANDLTVFLEGLNSEEWGAFWSPWSCFQIVHGFSLLLYIASTAHRVGQSPSVLFATGEQTYRQVRALQRGSEASWEVAEVSLSRIRLLLGSMPYIAELQSTMELLTPPPDLADPAGAIDQNAGGLHDFDHWINSTDWMTGMPSWADGSFDLPQE